MTKDEKIDVWRRITEKQAASGISAAAFCREQNLNINQFNWWKRRFRKADSQSKESGFLQLIPYTHHQQSGIRICLQDKISIEVEKGFDPRTLKSVIDAIR